MMVSSGSADARQVRLAPALAAVLLLCASLLGAAEVTEYQLKAEFLERFTRFIDWPAGALPEEEESPFVIGIVGANPFGRHLAQLAATRRIKGHPVLIREFSSPEGITRCHMLFIASSAQKELQSILERVKGSPVLTVGDTTGFARRGVMINFYQSEGRVRFEVNTAAAENRGLHLKAKLLKLARIVEGEGE